MAMHVTGARPVQRYLVGEALAPNVIEAQSLAGAAKVLKYVNGDHAREGDAIFIATATAMEVTPLDAQGRCHLVGKQIVCTRSLRSVSKFVNHVQNEPCTSADSPRSWATHVASRN